jgi:hypothetical protein
VGQAGPGGLERPRRIAGLRLAAGGPSPASLVEAAFASALASPKISPLEQLLIAKAFGSAVAETLAPILAEQLTPRLMKYLDQVMAGKPTGKGRPVRLPQARRAQIRSQGITATRHLVVALGLCLVRIGADVDEY